MDYRYIFSDPRIAREFLDRFPELAEGGAISEFRLKEADLA